MYEAEDHQFFDELYQQWSKTTGAEHGYWMPEKSAHEGFDIVAVNGEEKTYVGYLATELDADFVTGLHGAVPDLIRRLHEAIDEAVRKDEHNDIAQGQLADALLENEGLKARILDLEKALGD